MPEAGMVEPYQQLAVIYDEVMAHVDYKQWARYLKTIIQSNYPAAEKIADLSCGTGSLLAEMDGSYKMVGSDLAPAMLRQAHHKKKIARLPLFSADFTALPLASASLDVALVLYDSVNYLLEKESVAGFFREINRLLRPQGILIFDAVTPHICQTAFKNYHETEQLTDQASYQRRSWYDGADRMQYNSFILELDGESFEEVHAQRIRTLREWKKLLRESPLQLLHSYANFTFRPAHRKVERAHFVCRQKTQES